MVKFGKRSSSVKGQVIEKKCDQERVSLYMGQAPICQCVTISAIRKSNTLASLISIQLVKFTSLLPTRMS